MIDINTISSEFTTMLMHVGTVLFVNYFMQLIFVKDKPKGIKADDPTASNSQESTDLVPLQKPSYFFNSMSHRFGQAKVFVLRCQMWSCYVARVAYARVSVKMESVTVSQDFVSGFLLASLVSRRNQQAVADGQIHASDMISLPDSRLYYSAECLTLLALASYMMVNLARDVLLAVGAPQIKYDGQSRILDADSVYHMVSDMPMVVNPARLNLSQLPLMIEDRKAASDDVDASVEPSCAGGDHATGAPNQQQGLGVQAPPVPENKPVAEAKSQVQVMLKHALTVGLSIAMFPVKCISWVANLMSISILYCISLVASAPAEPVSQVKRIDASELMSPSKKGLHERAPRSAPDGCFVRQQPGL